MISYIALVLLLTLEVINCQNYRRFPPLINLARNQPLVSSPTQSSCGIPTRSTFCRSWTSPSSVTSCVEDYCDQACPLRYALPDHNDLLTAGTYGGCVTKDTINLVHTSTSFSALFEGMWGIREAYRAETRS